MALATFLMFLIPVVVTVFDFRFFVSMGSTIFNALFGLRFLFVFQSRSAIDRPNQKIEKRVSLFFFVWAN